MTAIDVLTKAELARLDVAISVISDERLRDLVGLMLVRHGILPADACNLHRADFIPQGPDFPAQVTTRASRALGRLTSDGEVTILSTEAGAAVARILETHDSHVILPGMLPGRLVRLLGDRCEAAGIRVVTPQTLRNTVRLAVLAGEPV